MSTKYQDVVQARIAASEATDSGLLEELASHPFLFVRLAVAANPASTAPVLTRLLPAALDDEGFQVCAAMLAHPASTAEHGARAFELLRQRGFHIEARDYSGRRFIEALFSHRHGPSESAAAVLSSLPDHLRSLIATTSANRAVLTRLSQDRSPKISAKAARQLALLAV